ncbi:MAG: hypothetical protein ACFFDT_18250 [Candidatus Hodarchaeota archaeon]
MLSHQIQTRKYGFLLIEFTDVGPKPLIGDQLPSAEREERLKLADSIAMYLFFVSTQGQAIFQPGFYAPLPYIGTPDHDLYAYAFFCRDPSATDPRTQKTGSMTIFAFFVPRNDQTLLRARFSLERALHACFVEKYPDHPLLTRETIPILFSQGKNVVLKTVEEGEKILQEAVLEEILADPRLIFLSFYNKADHSLALPIIGDEEVYPEKIKKIFPIETDVLLLNYQLNHKLVYIHLPEDQKYIIAIFENSVSTALNPFTETEFFEFGRKLYLAMPLIKEYYFPNYEFYG